MAAHTPNISSHFTLTGTDADSVTFDQMWDRVEVYNHDPVDTGTPLYVTFVVSDSAAPTAVADADDTYIVPPSSTLELRCVAGAAGTEPRLSIVGDGNKVSVTGLR